MIISYDGRDYSFVLDDITLDEGIAIQDYTGLSLQQWEESFLHTDSPDLLKSVKALVWVVLAQNGENLPGPAQANCKLGKFLTAFQVATAALAPAGGGEPPDPTRGSIPAPTSPESAIPPVTTLDGTAPEPPTPVGG